MKYLMRSAAALVLTVLLMVSLTACGGGGGGGGNGGSSGISYTGLTNPVTITSDNAVDVTTGAYQGGAAGAAISLGTHVSESNTRSLPGPLIFSQAIEKSVRKLDITSDSQSNASGTIQSESDTLSGDCGGSASYTLTYDDASGNFNGTATFADYCSEGVILSGSMTLSGNLDVGSGDILSLNCTLDNLTAVTGSDSMTMQGSIHFNFSSSSASVVFNALLRDNSSLKVYKIENYNMTLSEGSNYIDAALSGTFYDPDYGYVVLSTSTALRIYFGDEWPSQGVLVCTGNTGIAGGSTKAKLTALSSTNYQVEADTDGDDTYDYNSGPLLWAEL